MIERKVLYATKWLELIEMKDPENGVNGYVYTHAVWSGGQGVAVLPFRRIAAWGGTVASPPDVEFLLRQEITPCWKMTPALSSITGGMDHEGEDPIECAARELEEEGGYTVKPGDRWIRLGSARMSKSSTTVMHLFAVDLTDIERGTAEGDGTELEAKAYCEWRQDLHSAEDVLVAAMAFKLGNRWRL